MNLVNNPVFEIIEYDIKTKILTLILRNGHGTKYSHSQVPENIYNEFKDSGFSNNFYYKNIKEKYEKKLVFLTNEDKKNLNFPVYPEK